MTPKVAIKLKDLEVLPLKDDSKKKQRELTIQYPTLKAIFLNRKLPLTTTFEDKLAKSLNFYNSIVIFFLDKEIVLPKTVNLSKSSWVFTTRNCNFSKKDEVLSFPPKEKNF